MDIYKKKLLLFKIKRLKKEVLQMGGEIYSGSILDELKLFGKTLNIATKQGAKNIDYFYRHLGTKAKQHADQGLKIVGHFLEKTKDDIKQEFHKVGDYIKQSLQKGVNIADQTFGWFKTKYNVLIDKLYDFKDFVIIKLIRLKTGYNSINKFDPRNIVKVITQISTEAKIVYKSKGLFAAIKYVFTDDLVDVLAVVCSLIIIVLLIYAVFVAIQYLGDKYVNNKEVTKFSKTSAKTIKILSTNIKSGVASSTGSKIMSFLKECIILALKVFVGHLIISVVIWACIAIIMLLIMSFR